MVQRYTYVLHARVMTTALLLRGTCHVPTSGIGVPRKYSTRLWMEREGGREMEGEKKEGGGGRQYVNNCSST